MIVYFIIITFVKLKIFTKVITFYKLDGITKSPTKFYLFCWAFLNFFNYFCLEWNIRDKLYLLIYCFISWCQRYFSCFTNNFWNANEIFALWLRKQLLTWLPLAGGCFLLPKISITLVEKRSLPWLLSERLFALRAKYLRNLKSIPPPKSPLFVAIKWGTLHRRRWNSNENIGNRLTFGAFKCLPIVEIYFCLQEILKIFLELHKTGFELPTTWRRKIF